MALNLLDKIRELFDQAATEGIARALDAPSEAVAAGVQPSLATVIKEVVARSETSDGAEYLLRTVSDFEGNVHKNFAQFATSGSCDSLLGVGQRIASSLFREDEQDCVQRISELSRLDPNQASSLLHLVTSLVFDLAGEERALHSHNRTGVTKFFEAQRTLMRAELPHDTLQRVGLIDPELDGCTIEMPLPPSPNANNSNSNSKNGFVPPLQTPQSVSDTHQSEADREDTKEKVEKVAVAPVQHEERHEPEVVEEELGVSNVDFEVDESSFEQDESGRLRDEVADALSTGKGRRGARVVSPKAYDELQQKERDGKRFVDEADVVLSDSETRAFHAKSLLALATLATVWFSLLFYRGQEPKVQPTEPTTTAANQFAQQSPNPEGTTEEWELPSEWELEELQSPASSITKVRHTTTTVTAEAAGKDPLPLFAFDSTPSKVATSVDITPADSAARLMPAEFDAANGIWDMQNGSGYQNQSRFQETHTGGSPVVSVLTRATPANKASSSSVSLPGSALQPTIDLQRYEAQPAQVRLEPLPPGSQVPGVVAVKVVDAFRIPVFQTARPSGKSYYTP